MNSVSKCSIGLVLSASIERPTECERTETWFKPGKSFIYEYVATTENSFVGTTLSKSGLKFECQVQIDVPRKCEAILQVSECTLYERTPGSDDIYTQLPNSDRFSDDVSRHPVYYKFNKGEVLSNSIVIYEDELLYVVNIKRAIISALQLKIQEIDVYQHPLQMTDIFGSCPTTYIFPADNPNYIYTKRDITVCLVPQIYQLQTQIFSFIKKLYGGYKEDHVSEPFYPFGSTIDCQFKLKAEKQIENINCFQQQTFKPTAFNGTIYATGMSNISQLLELKAVSALNSRRFDRSMNGRKATSILFAYEENVDIVAQSQLLDQLHGLVESYTSSNLEFLPGQFHHLVRLQRKATTDILRQTMMSIWSCHGNTGEQCNSKYQTIEKDYYLDGLLSCGTSDCLSEFTHCLQHDHVTWFTSRYFMYDIALNHDVSVQVVSGILDLCKSTIRKSCWLPLGIMINKLSTSDTNISQADGPVYLTLLHLRQLIGDSCKAGIIQQLPKHRQQEEVDQLLLILKTLGNIGGPVQTVFDAVNIECKQLVSAILQCAKNTHLPQKVAKAAIQALKKLEVDSVIQEDLFEIIGDINRQPVIRTSAFSKLLVEPDANIVRQLLDLIHEETMEYMRMYMVASLQSMLENDQPDLLRLRMLWQQALQQDERKLPQIPDFLLGKSRYMELSRYFKLPLFVNMSGFQIELDVVYDPASPVLRSAVIRLNLYSDKKHNIIELGIDMEGLDVLLDAVVGKKGMGVYSLLKLFSQAQRMSQQQQRTGETTQDDVFTGFDRNVIQQILGLFEKANYPKLVIPDGMFHWKLFGHEVFYTEIKDIIEAIMMHHLQQQRGPSFAERLLQRLQQGLVIPKTRSTKLVDLNKVLPTVSGIPLNMTVLVTTSMSMDITANADVKTFMKRAGPLTSSGSLSASITGEFLGQLDVKLSTFYRAGMMMRLTGVFKAGTSATADFHMMPPTEDIAKHLRIEFDIENVNDEFNVAQIRSRLFLLHNTTALEIPGDPEYEAQYQKCFNELPYLLIGDRLCRTIVYPNVSTSKQHAYFPLSGPFEIDVVLQRADLNLEQFHFDVSYQQLNSTEGHLTDRMEVTFTGQGQKLQRTINSVIIYNRSHRDLTVDASMPEAQANYYLRYRHVYGRTLETGTKLYEFIFDEYLERKSKYLHRMMIKYKRLLTPEQETSLLTGEIESGNSTEHELSMMMAIPTASLHLELYNMKENLASHLVTELNLTYYCSKSIPLLYVFHVNPKHAAQNGDTTRIEFSNDAQFGYTTGNLSPLWNANDRMFLKYPGQIITLTNSMMANESNAFRSTEISYLTKQQHQKTIQMKAHVENHTDFTNLNYDYFMTLSNENTYNISFQGHLHGNMRDFNCYTVIHFTNTAESDSRRKRSLRDIYNKFQEIERNLQENPGGISTAIEENVDDSEASSTDIVSENNEDAAASVSTRTRPDPLLHCRSIFEWDTWNMTFNFTLKGKPVFIRGSRMPVGGELAWNLDLFYPNCNSYKQFVSSGTFGRHFNNTIFDFRYWFNFLNTHTTYSKGEDGSLQLTSTVPYNLNLNARYQWHQCMEVEMNYTGQRLNGSLEIIYQRQSPIFGQIAVHFHADSVWMLLNFDHTELYILKSVQPYGLSGIKHCLNSTHVLFDLQMNTTLQKSAGEITLHQDGIFIGKHPKVLGRIAITTDVSMSMTSLPVVTVTFSRTNMVYIVDLGLSHPRALNVTFSHQQPGNNKVQELTVLMEILGSSSMGYTLTWNPALTKLGMHAFKNRLMDISRMFIDAGDTVLMNVQRNMSDMVIPFVNKTVGSVVRRMVFPVLMYLPFKGVILGRVQNTQQSTVQIQKQEKRQNFKVARAGKVFIGGVMKISSRLLKFIGESLQKPPAVISPYLNNIVKPRFFHSLRNSEISFTLPLPFKWKHYMSLPKFTYSQNYVHGILFRTARKIVNGTQRSNENVRTNIALVYRSGKYIATFDGTVYHIPRFPGTSVSECTYLLAADFKDKKFAITLSNAGISLITSILAITIDFHGRVFVNGCTTAINLPFTNADSAIQVKSNEDGTIVADTKYGIKMTCDAIHDICSISLSGMHHNHTLGLLGTNDGEPGNDFRGSDSVISESVPQLLTDYALNTGSPTYCHNAEEMAENRDCDVDTLQSHCRNLFDNENSQFVTCFDRSSPLPFLRTCLKEAALCSVSICEHARAYTTLCGERGLYISQPSEPVDCNTNFGIDPVTNQKTPVDMVFVITNDFITERGHRNSMSDIIKLVRTLSETAATDIQLGIMGNSREQVGTTETRRHFINIQDLDNLPTTWIESSDGSLQALLKMATSYPFRYNSRKLVTLMTKQQTLLSRGERRHLLDVFRNKGIRLHVISKFSEIKGRRMIGINYDRQVILTNNKKKTSRLPQGELMKIVQQTLGSVLDIRPIIGRRRSKMSHIANHLVDNVSSFSCQDSD